jgi:hypothetical protein
MKKCKEISLDRFQLNVLLDKKQKEIFDQFLNQHVYCRTYSSFCKKGVEIKEIFLNSLNDIVIKGNCKICDGKVGKVLEFGEDEDFQKKAIAFRKSIEG